MIYLFFKITCKSSVKYKKWCIFKESGRLFSFFFIPHIMGTPNISNECLLLQLKEHKSLLDHFQNSNKAALGAFQNAT